MTRNDVRILDVLEQKKCVNQLQAITIRKITDEVKLSHTTVRNTVKGLTVGKLIAQGLGSGNALTYFITQQGISFLKEVKTC